AGWARRIVPASRVLRRLQQVRAPWLPVATGPAALQRLVEPLRNVHLRQVQPSSRAARPERQDQDGVRVLLLPFEAAPALNDLAMGRERQDAAMDPPVERTPGRARGSADRRRAAAREGGMLRRVE